MRLQFLLDTNTVSLALKGRSTAVVERLRAVPRSRVGISVITEMELRFGEFAGSELCRLTIPQHMPTTRRGTIQYFGLMR